MEQPKSDAPLAPPPSAADAFEALRREVADLRDTLVALQAEPIAGPDYGETLEAMAEHLNTAATTITWLARRAALTLTPEEMARQIQAAGARVRTADQQMVRAATDRLSQAADQLRGWIDTARLARRQNWRLVQSALAGLAGGAVLGLTLPDIVAQAAPETWAWPEARAARALHRDPWAAGERLLSVADPKRWREIQTARRSVGQNRHVLRLKAKVELGSRPHH